MSKHILQKQTDETRSQNEENAKTKSYEYLGPLKQRMQAIRNEILRIQKLTEHEQDCHETK